MDEYIERESAIAIIKEKQKELCPVGRYGRGYVYGSDRDKYDAWDEIIDALENIPSADVTPVVHGRWEWLGTNRLVTDCMCGTCSACKVRSKYIVNTMLCPNCGAKMDGGDSNEAD